MKKIIVVVGARPNFMKAAPLLRALNCESSLNITLVHTGQHYDKNMSDDIFLDLGMPAPDFQMGIGSGSHAQQTALIMKDFVLKT